MIRTFQRTLRPTYVRAVQLGSLLNQFKAIYIDNIVSERATSQLSITPPAYVSDPSNELVHPCIIYEKNGWNNYKYWMCVNPLPEGNASDEDPCLYVSDDGETWIEPPGFINPIATKSNVLYHLSDSLITLSPDKLKMRCYWRETGTNIEILWYSESSDGINWSEPIKIIDDTTTNAFISPSIIYKNGQYIMIAVKEISVGEYGIEIRTGSHISFGSPVSATINGLNETDYIWHCEIKSYMGIFFMLANIRSSVAERGGLVLLRSVNNGLTWIAGDYILKSMASSGLFDAVLYKSSFIYDFDNADHLKIWYGSQGDLASGYPYYLIGYTMAKLEQRTKSQMLLDNQSLAIVPTSPYVFGDLFERENSTGVGISPSNQTWQSITGSVNIINNQAGVPSDGNNKTYVDIGTSFTEIEAKFISESGSHQEYILIAYQDSANYYRIGWYTNRLYAQKISSGGNADKFLGSTSPTFDPANYIIKLIVSGTNVDIWVDGFFKKRFVLDWAMTTKVGLQIANTITKCDYVIAKI